MISREPRRRAFEGVKDWSSTHIYISEQTSTQDLGFGGFGEWTARCDAGGVAIGGYCKNQGSPGSAALAIRHTQLIFPAVGSALGDGAPNGFACGFVNTGSAVGKLTAS